jgi:L-lactate dehydrogenase complex protein LldE
MPGTSPHIGLFVTCLVDLFRPSVGFAAVRLLEWAGCRVGVPRAQTCCGQPGYNSGDRASARAIAAQVIAAFEGFDYVVAPSGSCAAMIRVHYPALLEDDPTLGPRALSLASRTHELTSFLVDVLGLERVQASFEGVVAYHDSCSGLRELEIGDQPRALLATVAGLTLKELEGTQECCGFGGAFCVKYPEIADRMAADKAAGVAASGADTLLGGDLGCLLHLAGRLSRAGSNVRVRHVAEVLAGLTQAPPIAGRARE